MSSAAKLPADWALVQTEDGKHYYYNSITGASQWEAPSLGDSAVDTAGEEPLPSGWERLTDDDGCVYFYHAPTGSSTWELPTSVGGLGEENGTAAGMVALAELPSGWHERTDEAGNHYYANDQTGETAWHIPGTAEDAEYRAYRAELVSFYEEYAPEKLGQVDVVMQQWRGQYADMIPLLRKKYEASVTEAASASSCSLPAPPLPDGADAQDGQPAASPALSDAGERANQSPVENLVLLHKGVVALKKFNHEKVYKERHIFLDPENLAFCWAKGSSLKDLTAAKSYKLSDVGAIKKGPPEKRRAADEGWPEYAARALTVSGSKKESVDLVFGSPAMCETWRRALASIVDECRQSSDFVALRDRTFLAQLVCRENSFEAFASGSHGRAAAGGGGAAAEERPGLGRRNSSLSAYATSNFQTSGRGGIFTARRKEEPEDLVNHSLKVIRQPLTQMPAKLEKKAVQTFSLILKYMGDDNKTGSHRGDAKTLRAVMSVVEKSAELRDEVFCQLVKQTRRNANADSEIAGWELLAAATSRSVPTDSELCQCLRSHARKRCGEPTVVGGLARFTLACCALDAPAARAVPLDRAALDAIGAAHLPASVFGEPLEGVLGKELARSSPPLGDLAQLLQEPSVPRILAMLCHAVLDNDGMETEGVFRLAGDQGDVQEMVEELSGGDYSRLERACDPLVAADVLKIWIRGVSPPLIPLDSYERCLAAADSGDLEEVSAILGTLTPAAFACVGYLASFLNQMATAADRTRMTESNLALVIAPNLLREPSGDAVAMLQHADQEASFVSLVMARFERDS